MAKKKATPAPSPEELGKPVNPQPAEVTAEPIQHDENLSTDRPIGYDASRELVYGPPSGFDQPDTYGGRTSDTGGTDTRGTGVPESSGTAGSPDSAGYGIDASGSSEVSGLQNDKQTAGNGLETTPGDLPENDFDPEDQIQLDPEEESGLAEEAPKETGSESVKPSVTLKDVFKGLLAGSNFSVLDLAPGEETPEEARSRKIKAKAAAELSALKAASVLRTLAGMQNPQSEERPGLEDRNSKKS